MKVARVKAVRDAAAQKPAAMVVDLFGLSNRIHGRPPHLEKSLDAWKGRFSRRGLQIDLRSGL
jgi:hypothetical protein